MARDYEKLLSDLHDGKIETFEVTKEGGAIYHYDKGDEF